MKKLRKRETRDFLHKYVKPVQSFAQIHGGLISLSKKSQRELELKNLKGASATFSYQGCDLQT